VIVLLLHRNWLRGIFLLIVAVAISFGLFNLYRQFYGRALAALFKDAEGLHSALDYLPHEAEIHEELGTIYLLDPNSFDPDRALRHFLQAVHASPFEPRFWIGLGRAYEQRGEDQRAEAAYLRAAQLAPSHFRPRWMYANFLLRSGRREQALAKLGELATATPDVLENICELIWQATGGDAQSLVRFASALAPDAKVVVSRFLLSQGKYPEGLDVWRSLAWDETKRASGQRIVAAFIQARQWAMADEVWREITKAEYPQAGEIELDFWNAKFEHPVTGSGYDWRVESNDRVKAGIDETTGQNDSRSLKLEFRAREGVSYSGAYHYLLVEPSTAYRLRFFYKTENMLAENGVSVEVADADNKSRLRVRADALPDASDWTERTISFVTSPETRAVAVIIARQPVSRLYDYIAGAMWFDSFSLARLQSSTAVP
jgi:hypothetical protein